MNKFEKVYAQMSDLPNGPIEEDARDRVFGYIVSIWSDLDGFDDTSMYADKLYRWEDVEWNDPELTFKIERHANTINGSSRAFLHTWQVNVKEGTYKLIRRGHRQLRPSAKRLNVKPLAENCSQLIKSGKEDELLKWSDSGQRVQIIIGKIISGGGVQQTVAARRKRFRLAVDELLGDDWRLLASPHNTWEKIT